MAYVKGVRANQISKVLAWLKDGITPEAIARSLECSVECIKSFEGKGKDVIPSTVPKLEPKGDAQEELNLDAQEVEAPTRKTRKKSA